MDKQNQNKYPKEVQDQYDRIVELSNRTIDNNEKVRDNQSVALTIGIWAVVVLVITRMDESMPASIPYLLVVLIICNAITLIVSFVIPHFVVNKNRVMQDKLNTEYHKRAFKTPGDVSKTHQQCLDDSFNERIDRLEDIRLCSIVFSVILLVICVIIYLSAFL